MCPPAIPAVLGVASAGLSIAGQYAAYQGQKQTGINQREQYFQSIRSAGKSLADQTAQENVRLQQEQAAGVEKQLDLKRDAAKVAGTIMASSDGGGGLSEALLLANVERDKARHTDTVNTNLKNQEQQSYWVKQGLVAEAEGRANANRPTGTNPSAFGLGVGIAGTSLNLYNSLRINRVGDIPSA